MYLPSQIVLVAPPLCGTMESAEREFAAALIVRACQVLGDAWKAVSPKDVGEVFKADIAAEREPLCSLNRNPFFRPDFWALADGKYGRWAGEPGGAIELTEQGIESLKRWARSAVVGDRHE